MKKEDSIEQLLELLKQKVINLEISNLKKELIIINLKKQVALLTNDN